MTRILCDTHIYFWWVTADARLPRLHRDVLEDRSNEVFVSAVVAWELATKHRLGKWHSAGVVLDQMNKTIAERELLALSISLRHAEAAGRFASAHRDPFDRLLAAQAEIEGIVLASIDAVFEQFNVQILR
jgi:PIN domain nuclease of toxin-antitoxin system